LGSSKQNQTLSATRILLCPPSIIYTVISDVGAYSQFVPYCQGSIVTKHSAPAKDGKSYPEEAKLLIGFNNDISEEFTSRVYCVPGRVVEAVSGNTLSSLEGSEECAHHSARPACDEDPSQRSTAMAHLRTRWTLMPYPYKPPPVDAIDPTTYHKNVEKSGEAKPQDKTQVHLDIEFAFANPMYAALSKAAAPKVAEKMIEAFEKRVRAVMEGQGHVERPRSGRMQGVIR
jgi:coenzyme Q-binding protein COQ10